MLFANSCVPKLFYLSSSKKKFLPAKKVFDGKVHLVKKLKNLY